MRIFKKSQNFHFLQASINNKKIKTTNNESEIISNGIIEDKNNDSDSSLAIDDPPALHDKEKSNEGDSMSLGPVGEETKHSDSAKVDSTENSSSIAKTDNSKGVDSPLETLNLECSVEPLSEIQKARYAMVSADFDKMLIESF